MEHGQDPFQLASSPHNVYSGLDYPVDVSVDIPGASDEQSEALGRPEVGQLNAHGNSPVHHDSFPDIAQCLCSQK